MELQNCRKMNFADVTPQKKFKTPYDEYTPDMHPIFIKKNYIGINRVMLINLCVSGKNIEFFLKTVGIFQKV